MTFLQFVERVRLRNIFNLNQNILKLQNELVKVLRDSLRHGAKHSPLTKISKIELCQDGYAKLHFDSSWSI